MASLFGRQLPNSNDQIQIEVDGGGGIQQNSNDSSFGNQTTASVESPNGIRITGLNFIGDYTRFIVFSDNSNNSSDQYEPKVFSEGYDPALGNGSKRKVWINGVVDNTYGDGNGDPANLDFTGGSFSIGNIAEIIFFDQRLSDDDILIVDERLRRKHGIKPTCFCSRG